MTAARATALLAAFALGSGCSGSDSTARDAGPAGLDGGYEPPACEADFGRTYIFDSVAILPVGEGVDITGDGEPDNLLGKIAALANPTIVDAIDGGTGIFLLDFTGWEPLSADDPDIEVTFYLGVDGESPPDPSNNRSGEGEFMVVDRQFDVDCQPLTRAEGGFVEDGIAHANPEVWRFLVEGAGTIEYLDMELAFEFDESFSTFAGDFGAGWSTCTMYRSSGPLYAGGNLLATTVNNVREPAPDLDLDGDGLERFEGDGEAVVACIDGDGTRIEDPDCPCDPRIADAYSVSARVVGVRATISGILHNP